MWPTSAASGAFFNLSPPDLRRSNHRDRITGVGSLFRSHGSDRLRRLCPGLRLRTSSCGPADLALGRVHATIMTRSEPAARIGPWNSSLGPDPLRHRQPWVGGGRPGIFLEAVSHDDE